LNYAGKFDAKLSADGLDSHSHAYVHTETVNATHAPADAIIVPDAQLLFHGDFKRSGVDLVLSRDDHELVLHDYFKGQKHAPLALPDGAYLTGDIVDALTGHVQYAQADGSASVGHVIGHVTKLAGSAGAIRNGVSIILNAGDNVEKGDVIQSGSNSTLGITFIDGTVFALSSNSRMVLNEMIYDPNGSNNSTLLSLVAGTISFVAGETAKHGDMKIDTPVATMGIRGTAGLVGIDYQVPIRDLDPGADYALLGPPTATIQILVEPDGTTGNMIVFDKATLAPLATLNDASRGLLFSNGNFSIINGLVTVDQQKLINDLFSQQHTDADTKSIIHYTSVGIPDISVTNKLPDGTSPIGQFILLVSAGGPQQSAATPAPSIVHIPGKPDLVIVNGAGQLAADFAVSELTGQTGDTLDKDTVSGIVRFADINAPDLPTVSMVTDPAGKDIVSATYQNALGNDVTAALNAQQLADISAVEVNLGLVPNPANKNTGFTTWTYSVPDNAFDFLAAGEKLTLTYTARVDNNYLPNDEFSKQTFTITITGTNDAPTVVATGADITKHIGTGVTANDFASGAITFSDPDLTDRPIVSTAFSSFQVLDAHNNDITSTLTGGQIAAVVAVEIPLAITQAAENTNYGSAAWAYSVSDQAFDFLAPGNTLILNYAAQVDDGHGGVVTQQFAVTINTEAPPVVLPEGVNTNSLGLPTEAFETQLPGSLSNNGAGTGDFHSAFLDATFTGSGNAGIVNGSFSGVTAAPFFGPLPGNADITNYLSIGAGGQETITFGSDQNAFGFYWGSVDAANTVNFYNGTTLVASYTGADVAPLFSNGNQSSFSSNGYVEFSSLAAFNTVVFSTDNTNAFEVDNISSGSTAAVSAPVSGMPQNQTFNNVGNGEVIFAGSGQDTFVFNAGFGTATINNFDVTQDAINIGRVLFENVSAILASAQPINSGHDTIITDTAHDTITLTNVTIAQLQAHTNLFHLI
jgi:VCBS repeat-containing protein